LLRRAGFVNLDGMKVIFLSSLGLISLLQGTMPAQPAPVHQASVPLWPDGAPGALGREPKDIPTLTLFLPEPDKATGAAMVICPGGGYSHLAPHEGGDYARWLNDQGIAGFVLQYRLGSAGYRHPRMLEDAARALRLVRFRAAEWKIDPKRIGIIGSSAGGHLASTLLTHFDAGDTNAPDPIDRVSSRPDIGVLCYAVITMGDLTHHGSRDNLLGANPPPQMIDELSNERHVTKETPPCFIFHTAEDATVPVQNSLEFAGALRRAGVLFELHIYQHGQHGLGLGSRDYDPSKWHPWTMECRRWLKEQGFGK
jgi:acetyl esterase/lipase